MIMMAMLPNSITLETFARSYISVVNGRNDGTWLFPVAEPDYSFTDWAGCSNNNDGNPCIFDGLDHSGFSDGFHSWKGDYGHNGIDIAVYYKNVFASAAGKVKAVVDDSYTGRGKYIIIEHPIDSSYSYYSVYQHLNSMSKKVGDTVNAGDVIGVSGDSGSTGQYHLHFAILLGAKDYTQSIDTMESGGWFLKSENEAYRDLNTKTGKSYGRIVNNPSVQTHSSYSLKITYPGSLEAHCGSVTYTFDKSKVSIGQSYHSFTPVEATISEGSYRIRNSNGLYLSAYTDSNGGAVTVVKSDSSKAQIWDIKKTGTSNVYSLVPQSSPSGRALNVYTATSSKSGDKLTLWGYTGDGSQSFVFGKTENDTYTIHPQYQKNLAVMVNSTLSPNNKGDKQQQWFLEGIEPTPIITPPPVPTPTPSPIPTPIPSPIPGVDQFPVNTDIILSKVGRVTTVEPAFYQFTILTDGLYRVQCESDIDVRAWIYDKAGNNQAYKHSDLITANSFNVIKNKFIEELLYYLHKGTYTLMLTGEPEQYYTITIDKINTTYGEDVEPNESISSAVSIGLNGKKGGYLNGFRDNGELDNLDWYVVSIPNAATHTAKLEIPGYHDISLGELRVFNSAGEDITAGSIVYNSLEDKYNISLDINFPSKGKFYLRICSVGAPIPYQLTVETGEISFDSTVPSSPWSLDRITAADELGLITAEMRGAYQSTTTRAEFCRLAMRFLEVFYSKTSNEILKDRNITARVFSDTSDDAIGAAAALGITSGTSAVKNTFTPNGSLTREQAATMLRNVMNVIGVDTTPPPHKILWTDKNSISSWAQSACDVMYEAKIMLGTSKTALVFNPKSSYTHEQAIITIQNLWEYLKK